MMQSGNTSEPTFAEEKVKQKTTAVKSTQVAREVSGIVKRFYARTREAAQAGEPVAWLAAWMPIEIFTAMGIAYDFPEHYGPVCSAKQASTPYLERAEADGFANYVCSYARNWLGFTHRMQEVDDIASESPWGGLARPTMLVGRTSCEAAYKGFQAIRHYFAVPLHVWGSPRLPGDADLQDKGLKRRFVQYYVEQLKELIAFVERVSGRKLNYDELSEVAQRHHEAYRLWNAAHRLRRAVPCPMPTGDASACMFVRAFMVGWPEELDFCQRLYDEVKYRVDHKIGVIANEKYRLLWGGLAMWHNLAFFNSLEELGAVFVIDSAFYKDAFNDIDYSDPLEALALRDWGVEELNVKRAQSFGGVGDARAGLVLELARDYQVDGVILHCIASCRPVAVGWTFTKNMLKEKLDKPTLLLEGDICDARTSSEAQTRALVESFMETVRAHKEGREA